MTEPFEGESFEEFFKRSEMEKKRAENMTLAEYLQDVQVQTDAYLKSVKENMPRLEKQLKELIEREAPLRQHHLTLGDLSIFSLRKNSMIRTLALS